MLPYSFSQRGAVLLMERRESTGLFLCRDVNNTRTPNIDSLRFEGERTAAKGAQDDVQEKAR